MALQMGLEGTGVGAMRTGNRLADRVLDQLEAAWNAFHESYAGLSDDDLLIPGVTGAWSIRDLIAHITWWDNESLEHLPEVLFGKRPPLYSHRYGGIDAFNALMTERKAHLSLAEVRADAASTHQRLLDYLLSLDVDQWIGHDKFRRRLKLDTWGHYPIHTADILRWRETSPTNIRRGDPGAEDLNP